MTIAEQLNIKDFPFFINNDMQKEIYREMSNGWWYKREFDDKKREIYFEASHGYWCKREFDERGKVIYYENSDGTIRNKKLPEYTMEELVDKLGHNFKIKK